MEEIGPGLNKVLSQHLPGGTEDTVEKVRIISIPAQIRSRGLHNKSPNLHCLRQVDYVRKIEWRSSILLREKCSCPLCEMYSSTLKFS
jgi:hypothetical protein